MKSKQILGRVICGAVMALSAVAWWLFLSDWEWMGLLGLLFIEFEVYDGIEYFVSDRCLDHPKVFKRVNIAGGIVIMLAGLLGYINTVCQWGIDLTSVYVLAAVAFGLILMGHAWNLFFDSIYYFSSEEKKWQKTTWSVCKMVVAPVVFLTSVDETLATGALRKRCARLYQLFNSWRMLCAMVHSVS